MPGPCRNSVYNNVEQCIEQEADAVCGGGAVRRSSTGSIGNLSSLRTVTSHCLLMKASILGLVEAAGLCIDSYSVAGREQVGGVPGQGADGARARPRRRVRGGRAQRRVRKAVPRWATEVDPHDCVGLLEIMAASATGKPSARQGNPSDMPSSMRHPRRCLQSPIASAFRSCGMSGNLTQHADGSLKRSLAPSQCSHGAMASWPRRVRVLPPIVRNGLLGVRLKVRLFADGLGANSGSGASCSTTSRRVTWTAARNELPATD